MNPPPAPPHVDVASDVLFDTAFDFTEADLRSVARAIARRRPTVAVQASVVAAVVLVAVAAGWSASGASPLWPFAIAGLGVALPWLVTARAARSTLSRIRAAPVGFGSRRVVADASRLTVHGPSGSVQVSWSTVTGASEAGDWAVIEEHPDVMHPVPGDAIGGLDAFRVALNSYRVAAGEAPLPPAAPRARPWAHVPWSGRRAVLVTVAVLVADLVLGFLTHSIAELAGHLYIVFGGLAITVLALWVAVPSWRTGGLRALLGPRPRATDVGAGFAVGAAVVGLNAALMAAVAAWLPPDAAENSQAWLDETLMAAPVTTIIAVVVTGPIREELLFRGLLFRGLRRRWGAVGAAALSAALFAIVHPVDLSAASMVLVVGTFTTGLLLAAATLRRGTLVTPIVAHMFMNGVAIFSGFTVGADTPWVFPAGPDAAVSSYELPVGACAEGYPGTADPSSPVGWTASSAVPCEGPHDVEVYGAWAAGAPRDAYPGLEDLAAEADEGCFVEFEGYVGRDYASSSLDYLAIVPTEAAWAAGDRELRCILIDVEHDKLTGSARGSGW